VVLHLVPVARQVDGAGHRASPGRYLTKSASSGRQFDAGQIGGPETGRDTTRQALKGSTNFVSFSHEGVRHRTGTAGEADSSTHLFSEKRVSSCRDIRVVER
jgi:hypothetical protein